MGEEHGSMLPIVPFLLSEYLVALHFPRIFTNLKQDSHWDLDTHVNLTGQAVTKHQNARKMSGYTKMSLSLSVFLYDPLFHISGYLGYLANEKDRKSQGIELWSFFQVYLAGLSSVILTTGVYWKTLGLATEQTESIPVSLRISSGQVLANRWGFAGMRNAKQMWRLGQKRGRTSKQIKPM